MLVFEVREGFRAGRGIRWFLAVGNTVEDREGPWLLSLIRVCYQELYLDMCVFAR